MIHQSTVTAGHTALGSRLTNTGALFPEPDSPIRHREFTRRCLMELRASESVSIESSAALNTERTSRKRSSSACRTAWWPGGRAHHRATVRPCAPPVVTCAPPTVRTCAPPGQADVQLSAGDVEIFGANALWSNIGCIPGSRARAGGGSREL